jgi:hypothetical protein
MMLLVNVLATFASWLAGLACEATGIGQHRYFIDDQKVIPVRFAYPGYAG